MAKILSIIILLTFGLSEGWKCGGTHEHFQYISRDNHRMLYTRSTSWSPIRILYYYQNFDLGSSSLNTYFENTVMPSVNTFFTHALSVKPIQGTLSLAGMTNCGTEITIPAAHKNPGVTNTDLILYITSNNLSGQGYVAYAGACVMDGTSGNPLAGRIVINAPNFNTSSSQEQLSVVIHETTHVLGFSSGLFPTWRDSNGNIYKPSSLTWTGTLRGASKTLLITPNVASYSRSAFNCSTLKGMELEDQGGSGTVGSHWDMRTLLNEYMISHVSDDVIYSTITLAALQDSGWYLPDYTVGQTPIFARNIGCSFFSKKCITSGVSNYPSLFCDSSNSLTCDAMYLHKSNCNIVTYSSALPTAFQYFASSTTGGADIFTDYCPFRSRYANGSCRGNLLSTFVTSGASEVIGDTSRCFVSTLRLSSYGSIAAPNAACYPVIACSSTAATVLVGIVQVVCPFTGGSFSVAGYTGTLTCPSSNALCSDTPCKNGCYGSGRCVLGVCQCYSGYSGNDCSIVCGSYCAICTVSSCLTCVTGHTLSAGVCV